MVIMKIKSVEPVDSSMKIKKGNLITFLINEKNRDRASSWLKENGFESQPKINQK